MLLWPLRVHSNAKFQGRFPLCRFGKREAHNIMEKSCDNNYFRGKSGIADEGNGFTLCSDIAGMVAAMTKSQLDVTSEKISHNILG